MTSQEAFPPGVYRIKSAAHNTQLNTPVDTPLYLQLDPESGQIFLEELDSEARYQKWNINEVEGSPNKYRITGFNNKFNLSHTDEGPEEANGNGRPEGKEDATTEWVISHGASGETRICIAGQNKVSLGFLDDRSVYFSEEDPANGRQLWILEPISQPQSFQSAFFPLTIADVKKYSYDIIIVGSGIGGGVLAHDLYDTNSRTGHKMKILLLERGDLTFHTHCMNTARPINLVDDRGGHNDLFFHKFRKEYMFNPRMQTPPPPPEDINKSWKGGPMYSLGGRSAAWGLFIPRIHDKTLEAHFHPDVKKELLQEYYGRAERLMRLSLPHTLPIHQHVMDRLNIDGLSRLKTSEVQWNWGRVASEFQNQRNYSFAEGAYSSIDKLFEIASLAQKNAHLCDLREAPRGNFDIVLNAEVRRLSFRSTQGTHSADEGASEAQSHSPVVDGVYVKVSQYEEVLIKIRENGKVVLCAGSVNSPAILLRSGDDAWKQRIRDNGGLRLTDHDIAIYRDTFRYRNPADRARYGGMKLQTYFNISPEDVAIAGADKSDDNRSAAKIDTAAAPEPIATSTSHVENLNPRDIALANASIDTSSYLPWGKAFDPQKPVFIMAFLLERQLVSTNNITLDSTHNPVINMVREEVTRESTERNKVRMKAMATLTTSAITTLQTALGVDFVDFNSPWDGPNVEGRIDILPLGIVAHELGTLPMKGPGDGKACLDENLQVVPQICRGVYVCDLSCMPYSPESNPSLTLAALAIRLSRKLLPRYHSGLRSEEVCLVNHTGVTIKVRLSNIGGASDPNHIGFSTADEAIKPNLEGIDPGAIALEPGAHRIWIRPSGKCEAAFVYKPDESGTGDFVDRAVIFNAHPGSATHIRFE